MAIEGAYEAHPTGESEAVEKSLGMMLKAQYLSKEFNDVFSATELREHEIIGLAGVFSSRFVTLIMSTTEKDVKVVPKEEAQLVRERLEIKRRIMSDPNAMAFVIQDSYVYAFGLCRQSLKRQSRKEAVEVSTASISRAMRGEEIGLSESIKSKMGVGKYRTVYVPKE